MTHDRQPPSFPRVDESDTPTEVSAAAPATPLFSAADSEGAQTSAIVNRPIDPAAPRSRGGRVRWLVAGLATVLVFVLVGGVLFLAAPRAGAAPATAHYVPADTGMFADIRLDLPGDQHANLAALMSHFPGFADQASFQQKLDESLNTLLSNKTQGAVDWNNDVKPWFGGEIAVFGDPSAATPVSSCAACAMGLEPAFFHGSPPVVVVFTVTDKTKLQSVIDAKAGSAQVSSTDYQGQEIKTIAQPAGTSQAASYVITDDALLVSPDIDLLKQALDVKAGQPALADEAFFTQQLGALHADRLATVYFDANKQVSAMPLPSGLPLPTDCMQASQAVAKVKYVGELRAENDHFAFTIRSQVPTGDGVPAAPANKQTTLAQAMPADTMVYLEARNAGARIDSLVKNGLACMLDQTGGGPLPSGLGGLGNSSQLFNSLLGTDPASFLDFVDDAAIGLSYSNDKLSGGIVAAVNDQAVAMQRVGKLVGLIKLAGGFGGQSSGAQITSEQVDVNGTTVTVIHVASPDPGGSPITLQVAVANNRLYLGLDDFVTSALGRSTSDSLASSARYRTAISAAPGDNSGIVYVDVASTLGAYESQLPADTKQDFDTNRKPFLDHLSTFLVVSHIDSGMVISNGFLFVE